MDKQIFQNKMKYWMLVQNIEKIKRALEKKEKTYRNTGQAAFYQDVNKNNPLFNLRFNFIN